MESLEKKIFDYLSENLSPKRVEHSYQVSVYAVKLASLYGENKLNAQIAGLLHDCAKSKTDKELIDILKKQKKDIEYFKDIKKYSPGILHSFAGAEIAKKKFNIKNEDILNAIANHTFGRPDMSKLEIIIFVADFASYDRKYAHALKARKIAATNLKEAFIYVLSKKIEYIISAREWFCPQTLDTWNYYAKKTN